MKIYVIWFFVCLLSIAFGSIAFANPVDKKRGGGIIDSVQALAMGNIKAVETNGEIVFVSNSGRFVLRGTLHDSWQKKKLETIDEIQYAVTHIDVNAMGLNPENLNSITIQGGPEEIYAFIDPLCKYCKTFINEALQYTDKYTIHLVVVPALGEESNNLSRKLYCSADKSQALEKLVTNQLGGMKQKEYCDMKVFDFTLMIATIMEIQSVPFFIASDYRFRAGAGTGFWEWVKPKTKTKG